MSDHERLLPNATEAERGLLGAVLRHNSALDDAQAAGIVADDFYHDASRKIFTAMSALHEAGKPIDLVTMAESLKAAGQVEDIGGFVYLAKLWDDEPTAAHAVYYAEIIRDKARMRALLGAATEIGRSVYDNASSAAQLIEEAERKIFSISSLRLAGESVDMVQAMRDTYNRIDKRCDGESVDFIQTGFRDLDELIGGLQHGELIIIAARPGAGKTSLATSLAYRIAGVGKKPALFVSLEQSRVELAERMLCSVSGVDSHNVRTGSLSSEEHSKLVAGGEPLRKAKLFIDDTPCQSVSRIAANARRLKSRSKIECIFIDYLQLIEPENSKVNRQEQVSAISRRLKLLARELKIPVVCMAQLNRGSEDRTDHRPRLSDLRESGAIEQDADMVWMIHRPEMHDVADRRGEADVFVSKNRNGATGVVTLVYQKQFMRFEDFRDAPMPFEEFAGAKATRKDFA